MDEAGGGVLQGTPLADERGLDAARQGQAGEKSNNADGVEGGLRAESGRRNGTEPAGQRATDQRPAVNPAEQTAPTAEKSPTLSTAQTEGGESTAKSKPSFIDAVKTIFEKGKEYASRLYSMTFFDVAETPSFMKQLGLTGDKFTIRYGVMSRHAGKHDIPIDVWERLPEALKEPFAITRYYTDEQKQNQKGYRLYTAIQLSDGSYVVVSAEVKNAGRDIEVNAINTVFGRNSLSDVHDELIYTSENITPEQQALLNRNNPYQYPDVREISSGKDTKNFATDKKNVANSTESERKTTERTDEQGNVALFQELGEENTPVSTTAPNAKQPSSFRPSSTPQ